MTRSALILAALVPLVAAGRPAGAFDEQLTHPALTEASTRRSSLENRLRDDLALPSGLATRLVSGAESLLVLEWLRFGSLNEDRPPCRAGHHFHNPLKEFGVSGVTNQDFLVRLHCEDSGFQPPRSSVTWGTGFLTPTLRGPVTGNPFDWDAARVAFHRALTSPTTAERESELAGTFERLGHLLHLIQDLAVPAHVRNDFPAHTRFAPRAELDLVKWFSEPFEGFVRDHLDALLDGVDPAEVPDFAGQPVTRFWDTDRYAGQNPAGDLAQGLAEYTNANFVSVDTILTEDLTPGGEFTFPYPRRSSTNLDLLASKDDRLVRFVTAEDGREERVLYVAKTDDGVTFDRFLHLSVFAGDVLDKAPPGTPHTLLLRADDDGVLEAYAQKLLPAAIGYGAGLLDYFFRGRLDVDLVENEDGTLELEGVNGSADVLVDGVLALYADVPAGAEGGATAPVRRALTAVGDPAVRGVEPGQAITSGPFEPLPAERFVAVYTGRLGAETPGPAPLPGAVVGKVLGGARVEEVFLDGERWTLRTPTQLVRLADAAGPLTASRYETITWGDADDVLVARSPFGAGQPNTVTAYAVPRTPAEVTGDALAIATTLSPDGPVATLGVEAAAALPASGIALGTTVTIDQTIAYRQQLVTYDKVDVYQWQPGSFHYVFDHSESGAATVRTVGAASLPFHASFDLILDAAHYQAFSPPAASYAWTLTEVGAAADGRLVGVVRIDLTAPPSALRPRLQQPVLEPTPTGDLQTRITCFGGTFCFEEIVVLSPTYPTGTFWALVDLSAGVALASTAPPAVSFGAQATLEAPRWTAGLIGPEPLVYVFHHERRRGGPNDTPDGEDEPTVLAPLKQDFAQNTPPPDTTATLDPFESASAQSAVLGTELLAALAGAGLAGSEPGAPGATTDLRFSAGDDRVILHATTSAGPAAQRPIALDLARRIRPAADAERVLLLASGSRGGRRAAALVDWTLGGAVRLAQVIEPAAGEGLSVTIGSATPAVALVQDFNGRGYLVDLDDSGALRTIPDPAALSDFVLLNPRYLYGTRTLRFHRPDATLRATALPLRLLPVADDVRGDHHVLRVP